MPKYFKIAVSVLPATVLAVLVMSMPERAVAGSQPFVGEIAATGNTYCPQGWAEANGQLLAISQNEALFSLYGTTFGGDGRSSFGLPDLRGRIPVGTGNGPGLSSRTWGQRVGAERVSLNHSQLASHSHSVNANNLDGAFPGPGGKILAAAPPGGTGAETIYSDQPANRQMSGQMISPTGGSQSVSTEDPTLVVRYCVALLGVYPSRN